MREENKGGLVVDNNKSSTSIIYTVALWLEHYNCVVTFVRSLAFFSRDASETLALRRTMLASVPFCQHLPHKNKNANAMA